MNLEKNPSHFIHDDKPIESISWYDCQIFCERLNVELPTEKHWEYACRGGTLDKFNLGLSIPVEKTNFNDSPNLYREETTNVGELANKNSWGLYDIHGNVWEWCQGWWDTHKQFKIIRGGSWADSPDACRSAGTHYTTPNNLGSALGFRIVSKDLDD